MQNHDFIKNRFFKQEGGSLCPYCRPGCQIIASCKNLDPRNKGEFKPMTVKCCPECGRRMDERTK